MKRFGIISVILAGSAFAACANGQVADDVSTPENDTRRLDPGLLQVESAPTPATQVGKADESGGKVELGPGMTRLVDMAKADLITRLGADKAQIEVLRAEYVTWPDSSLGCPQPGFQYLQVLSNGSRIQLKVDELVFNYHSGGNRPPSYCTKPGDKEPLPFEAGET